jgi:hypothetical protein
VELQHGGAAGHLPPAHLRSLVQRAALLRLGLRDPEAKVQAAATKMLAAWLAEAGGDVAELLKTLHVENYTCGCTLWPALKGSRHMPCPARPARQEPQGSHAAWLAALPFRHESASCGYPG